MMTYLVYAAYLFTDNLNQLFNASTLKEADPINGMESEMNSKFLYPGEWQIYCRNA